MLTPAKLTVLCEARDRICELSPDAPSVQDIATTAGLSTGLFIRQFAALFGETPHQMRIRVRLERAKQLLASGEISVTQACFEVGFSSLGSFSTLFRRKTGMTPSEYRERHQGEDLRPGCLTLMGALPKSDDG